MASTEHINLSTIIKETHKKLRNDTKKFGEQIAWSNHLKEKQQLNKYAQAMQELATNFWEQNTQICSAATNIDQTRENNRIQWSVKFCIEYFSKIIFLQRQREFRILEVIGKECDPAEITLLPQIHLMPITENSSLGKIKLLDVGSCYNPFSKFNLFDVTAVDIAPANQNVIECDFLSIEILNNPNAELKKSNQFYGNCFDVVVFSLLLEYLPTSQQRINSCRNALKLLKCEGILIIITPDSKHVGANAKLMKNWRYTLALMGFNRIRIEKLNHITTMVFRKAVNELITQRWARIHKESYMTEAIHIPQDFNNEEFDVCINSENEESNRENDSQEISRVFTNELPNE